jgi:multiple sugar transport system permease protein
MSIPKKKWTSLLLVAVGAFFFIIMMFPIYLIAVTSFKSQLEIFTLPVTLWPRNFSLDSYVKQFSASSTTMRGFKNSFIVSTGGAAISTILSIPAAYGLARFRFKARKTFILIFLITQMLPSTLVLTSLYIMFSRMGLLNSYLAPILADATLGIPFSVIILRTYFVSIPKELDESARIDGCYIFGAFLRIMLPIAQPGVVVAIVFSFVYAWGDLINGLTFIIDPAKRPITVNIYEYVGQYNTSWNMTMAFGIIAIFPIILIFIFMQRYIVTGLTNGAVKG